MQLLGLRVAYPFFRAPQCPIVHNGLHVTALQLVSLPADNSNWDAISESITFPPPPQVPSPAANTPLKSALDLRPYLPLWNPVPSLNTLSHVGPNSLFMLAVSP